MEFEKGLSASFHNAYSWIKDSKAWKYYALFVLLSIVFNSIIYGTAIGVLSSVGVDVSDKASFENLTTVLENIALLGTVAVFLLALFLAYIAVYVFLFLKIAANSIEKQGFKTIPLNAGIVLRYILLSILVFFHAAFSWFDKKFLALLAASILFLLTGTLATLSIPALGIVLLSVGGLAGLTYFVIMIRNTIRLSMANFVFLRTNAINHALQESWRITSANALKIFGVEVLIGLVFAIATVIVSLPFAGMGWIIESVTQGGSMALIGSWANTIINAFPGPLETFFGIYLSIAIYGLLAKENHKVSKAPVKKKPLAGK
ncbi:MAG: hypothetical protein ACE5DI_04740 [Candidatus Micrarchaeia archaeon]